MNRILNPSLESARPANLTARAPWCVIVSQVFRLVIFPLLLISCLSTSIDAIAQGVSLPNSKVVNAGRISKRAKKLKKKRKLKSTYTKSSISKKVLRASSPSESFQTILNRIPSIHAYSDGPNGMRSHIQMRGFSGNQIAQTFDGIPLNDLFNGSTTNYASSRNAIPFVLGNLSGVQVYRGINKPTVSSLNGLGGTINYVPRSPTSLFGAQAFIGGGSFSTRRYGAFVNTGAQYGFKTLVGAQKTTTNGWLNNTLDTNSNFYLATSKVFNGGLSKLHFYFIENHNRGYTPHTVPFPLINRYGYSYQWPLHWGYSQNWDTHKLAILDLENAISNNATIEIKAYYLRNKYNRTSYANPQFIQGPNQPYYLPNQPESWVAPGIGGNTYNPVALFGSALAGTKYHLYIYHSQELGAKPTVSVHLSHNTIVFGGNFVFGTLHSEECWYGASAMPCATFYNSAWNERDQRDYLIGFAEDEISVLDGRLSITPGIKYSHVDTTDADNEGYYYSFGGTVSNSESYSSPSLGISYTITPHMSIYASWGKTQKVPEISAYYSAIGIQNNQGQNKIPPVSVKPEYVTDEELGWRYIDHGWDASVNVYRTDFQNKFNSYTPLTGQFSGLSIQYNGGTARYQGIEYELEKSVGHFYAFANYSLNTATYGAFTDPFSKRLTPGAPLSNVPHKMLNVGVGGHWGNLVGELYAKYTSAQYAPYFVNGLTSSYAIPPYTVLNLHLSYVIPFRNMSWVKDLEISMNISNLTDKHYFNYGYVNTNYSGQPYVQGLVAEPRAYYLQLTAHFN